MENTIPSDPCRSSGVETAVNNHPQIEEQSPADRAESRRQNNEPTDQAESRRQAEHIETATKPPHPQLKSFFAAAVPIFAVMKSTEALGDRAGEYSRP